MAPEVHRPGRPPRAWLTELWISTVLVLLLVLIWLTLGGIRITTGHA